MNILFVLPPRIVRHSVGVDSAENISLDRMAHTQEGSFMSVWEF